MSGDAVGSARLYGLLGCGKMAARHLGAIMELDPGASVLLYDRVPEIARALAGAHGPEVRSVDSPDEIFGAEGLTAVLVLTPTPTHGDYVIRALGTGANVFCEKPLAMTGAEVERIGDALEAAGDARLLVGYLYRHMEPIRMAREVLRSGALGTVRSAIFRLGGRGSAAAWKHERGSGGGVLREMAVHELDTAQWLFGDLDLESVLEHTLLQNERTIGGEVMDADADDFLVFRLRAGPVSVLVQADLTSPGFMQWIEVQGERGTLFASVLGHLPTYVQLSAPAGGYEQGVTVLDTSAAESAHLRQMREFLQPSSDGDWAGLNDSLAVARVVDGVETAS